MCCCEGVGFRFCLLTTPPHIFKHSPAEGNPSVESTLGPPCVCADRLALLYAFIVNADNDDIQMTIIVSALSRVGRCHVALLDCRAGKASWDAASWRVVVAGHLQLDGHGWVARLPMQPDTSRTCCAPCLYRSAGSMWRIMRFASGEKPLKSCSLFAWRLLRTGPSCCFATAHNTGSPLASRLLMVLRVGRRDRSRPRFGTPPAMAYPP